MRTVGIILVAIGAVALAYQGFLTTRSPGTEGGRSAEAPLLVAGITLTVGLIVLAVRGGQGNTSAG